MPYVNRAGIGGIVFAIGAIIYIINLIIALSGQGRLIPLDGVGLMVLGIGLALLLRSRSAYVRAHQRRVPL